MNTSLTRKRFTGILTALMAMVALTSCGSNTSSTGIGGSGLFDISGEGAPMTPDRAYAFINGRHDALQSRIADVLGNGRMFYMGGYDQYADGSGASFPTSCGPMADGRVGCHRSGDQEMVSNNGLAQFAPSEHARLDDLIVGLYDVLKQSLARQVGETASSGSYSQIELSDNASVKGIIGRRKVDMTGCMRAAAHDPTFKMAVEFFDCPTAFLARAERKGNMSKLRVYWSIEKQ